MFPIYLKTTTGRTYTLNVDSQTTVLEAKRKLFDESGIPVDRQKWIYAGKRLEGPFDDRPLSDAHIGSESTVHLVLNLRSGGPDDGQEHTLPQPCSNLSDETEIDRTREAWDVVARAGNFDVDLQLVDPDAYHAKLDFIERRVVTSSEFFRCGGQYDISNDGIHNTEEMRPKLPEWFSQIPIDDPVDDSDPENEFEKSWQQLRAAARSLAKSYCIIWQVLESFRYLHSAMGTANGSSNRWTCKGCSTITISRRSQKSPDLCNACVESGIRGGLRESQPDTSAYFSFLRLCPGANIAELKRVSERWLCHFQEGIGNVTGSLLLGDDIVEILEDLRDVGKSFMDMVGLDAAGVSSPLTLIRAIALFLDLALVSYAGSHGIRMDLDYLKKPIPSISVDGIEQGGFDFSCTLGSLACLDGFLGGKNAWVFQCSLTPKGMAPLNSKALKRLSVLTTIDTFADVWGPVYAITSIDSKTRETKVKHFEVARGAIVPLPTTGTPAYRDAKRCHWYDSTSYYLKKRLIRLFSMPNDVSLSESDLLLIGGPYRHNHDCAYTFDDFEADYSDLFGPLGTKPSEWQTETRGVQVGFSKIAGGNVNMGQRKVPGTPIKQTARNRWKDSPEFANPTWLNHALGVEISHCTGNARRVCIKDLLFNQSVAKVLERQHPRWRLTMWGREFLKALDSERGDAIIKFWTNVNYTEFRKQVAALVFCMLDLLEETGLRGGKFQAAFLNNHQEWAMELSLKRNDWAKLLEDSHLTATYAVMVDMCLECEVPNHSASTCTITEAKSRTVLQTTIMTSANPTTASRFRIDPQGATFKKVDVGGRQHLVISPEGYVSRGLGFATPIVSTRELQQPTATRARQHVIFIRSTNESYGGMKLPRDRTRLTSWDGSTRPTRFDVERMQSLDDDTRSIASDGSYEERTRARDEPPADDTHLRPGASSSGRGSSGSQSSSPLSRSPRPGRSRGGSGASTPTLNRRPVTGERPSYGAPPPSPPPPQQLEVDAARPTWHFPHSDANDQYRRPPGATGPVHNPWGAHPPTRVAYPNYSSRATTALVLPHRPEPPPPAARVYTYLHAHPAERQAVAGADETRGPSAPAPRQGMVEDPFNYVFDDDHDEALGRVIEESISGARERQLRRQPHFDNTRFG